MQFRKLYASEVEVRVQSVMQRKDGYACVLLLYKTARTDANILDESGVIWENDFKLVDDKLFGGIGIYEEKLGRMIWKWDCGTESNTEKEKGQASDCFKRAGFKWGIGRELYSSPFIYVKLDASEVDATKGSPKCRISFECLYIEIDDDRTITGLEIVDNKGNVRYSFNNGKVKNVEPKQEAKVETQPKVEPTVYDKIGDLWRASEDWQREINSFRKGRKISAVPEEDWRLFLRSYGM